MRKRLIELILNTPVLKFPSGSRAQGKTYQTAQNVADHLLAKGVIVPCVNIGQIVYRIYWDFKIDVCKVSALTQKSDETWKIRITSGINRSVFEVTPDELGKTIFLTKEQAEKALAERREYDRT